MYEKYGYEFFKTDKDIGGEDSRVYCKALTVDGPDKDRRSENGVEDVAPYLIAVLMQHYSKRVNVPI